VYADIILSINQQKQSKRCVIKIEQSSEFSHKYKFRPTQQHTFLKYNNKRNKANT
ncbi:MAG: hypothetical protein ACI8RD_012289, partial [Bacillariaceae sp.]